MRLNPDARLAVLSRVRLAQPGNVREMAKVAETQPGFSVPTGLKSTDVK